ncbi:MAG: antibiotic biosynthesis monooxygenase family protein [Microbacterium sp.]
MFAVIWEYTVHPGCEAAFEALYGADGAWAGLFAGRPGYRATELLHEKGSRRYLTIDRWDSAADYDAFLANEHSRYGAIDAEGDRLTENERCVGRYSTGAGDDR